MKRIYVVAFVLSICLVACDKNHSVRKVTFSQDSGLGSETLADPVIVITLDDIDPSGPVKVDYTVSGGTAIGGGVDFTLANGTAIIAPNTTAVELPITIMTDFVNEEDETIIITLSNPVNCVIGPYTTFTYTMTNHLVDPSLIFYLPMNGNVGDSSIYHNNNIITNIAFAADRDGNNNGAGVFDDHSTFLEYPNTQTLDSITNVTLAAWVLPVSFYGTGSNPIIEKASSDVNATGNPLPYFQYHLGMTGDQYWHYQGVFTFAIAVDNQYVSMTTPLNTWIPGTWVHVAGTYDGTILKIYVNGVLNSILDAPGSMGHYGRPLFIGKQELENDTPHQCPGTFDDLRIYSRALSAQEITNLYNR